MRYYCTILCFGLMGFSFLQAQSPYFLQPINDSLPQWVHLLYQPDPDPGQVISAFEAWRIDHPYIKNQHTQYYKRWLRQIDRTLKPHTQDPAELEAWRRSVADYVARSRQLSQRRDANSTWQSIGPWDWDHEAAERSYAPGAAHVYSLEQAPSNGNILLAGTATAGLWKSVDKGLNWFGLTLDKMQGSVLAVEISHANSNHMYYAASDSIYGSTDGGQNWTPLGDAAFQSLGHSVRDIVMHPTNALILYLASDEGLFKSTDAGQNWILAQAGLFQEIEFHPTQADTIYAVAQDGDQTRFYRSLNGGTSFTPMTNGWPNPNVAGGAHQRRTEIAVSAAAPNEVYALATGNENGGSGLYGVYVSTDAGLNWTFQCCGPQPAGPPSASNKNLMGWSDEGLDDGGQYYYDLAFDVSPFNADSMFVAGVNLWISDDGGLDFVCPAKWSHPAKAGYVHADIHDVRYYDSGDLWVVCDGGIFYSQDNGLTFQRRMTGISGTDFWGFGVGFWESEVMLGGTYHNGTLLKDDHTYINDWISTDGGDNYRGFVNFGNGRIVYSDYNIKQLSGDRMTGFQKSSFNHKPNATYTTGASSDLAFDPRCYNHYYSGDGTQLWKTEDGGSSHHIIHDFGETVTSIEVSRANPNVLYIATYPDWWGTKNLWRSQDAGLNWTNITPSSAQLNSNIWVPYDIAVDDGDPNKIWIARTSQYGNYPGGLQGHQVYYSQDGGSSWNNWSTAMLNGEYPTNIVHQMGTDGGIYIGTRRAVYYRNASMSDWALFNHDLPLRTHSVRLIPNYRLGKLRNGTNRSVYEVDFYEDSQPIVQAAADRLTSYCTRDTVYFVDHSILNETNASWTWSFPGGTPSTSTLRNPKVVYTAPGTYSVSLSVADDFGTDSRTFADFLTVENRCEPDTIPGTAMDCTTPGDYAQIPDLGITTNVFTITAWVKPDDIQDDYTGIVMNDGDAAGLNFRPNNELAYHWPGGAWWWASGLTVPVGEWSYVALVATPTQMRVYLNGVEAVHTTNLTATALGTMKIGSYKGWSSRNFRGLIDEVALYERALTIDEIRELRHLTRKPTNDPDLLAYYQFNEPDGPANDKAHIFHANLSGGAVRTLSTGPFGGGVSNRMFVNTGGLKIFGATGLELSFPLGGSYPNGDLVVSRINVEPDQYPNANPASRSYWIVNNYGSNFFSPLSQMDFKGVGYVSVQDATTNPQSFKLYKRDSNADGATWGLSLDDGDAAVAGGDGDVTFNTGLVVGSFSQFVILNEGSSFLPVEWLHFQLSLLDDLNVLIEWATTKEENLDYYVVERRAGSEPFSDWKRVEGPGLIQGDRNLYQIIDPAPILGYSEYRIRQVDLDGQIHYSERRSLVLEGQPNLFRLYPNPLKQHAELNLIFQEDQPLKLELFDASGRKVFAKSYTKSGKIQLPDLTKGAYHYQARTLNSRYHGTLIIY